MANGNFLNNSENRTLLWTNPNEADEFGEESVSVTNANKYSLLEIIFRPTNQSDITDNTYITQFVDLSYNKAKLSYSGFLNAQSTTNRACGAYRNLTVNNDTISFESGLRVLFSNSTLADSYCVVPVKIYGIR